MAHRSQTRPAPHPPADDSPSAGRSRRRRRTSGTTRCAVDELEYAISYRRRRRDRRIRRSCADVWKTEPDPLAATCVRTLPETADVRPRSTSRGPSSRRCRSRGALCCAGFRAHGRTARVASRCRPSRRSTARRADARAGPCRSTTLAPNIIVKFPATSVGDRGDARRSTYRGGRASTPRCRVRGRPGRSPQTMPIEKGLGVARPRGPDVA